MIGHSVKTLNEYRLRCMTRTSRPAPSIPGPVAGVLGDCAGAVGASRDVPAAVGAAPAEVCSQKVNTM